jgi:hypothetical protein
LQALGSHCAMWAMATGAPHKRQAWRPKVC